MTTKQKATSTPTPTPTPGAAPQTITQLLSDLNNAAGKTSGSSASTADLFGLGTYGQQKVNPGDLPFLTDILASGGATTADAIVKAFLAASPDKVATIQHALVMAGFYPSSYTPKYGIVSPEDRDAFDKAVTLAGQSGQAVSSLLEQGAAYGASAGIAAAQSQSQQGKVATVTLPNTQNLENAAITAFQNELGRKATPKEAAAFAAAYRAMSGGMQRQQNQQTFDATNPPAPSTLQGNPMQIADSAMQSPAEQKALAEQNPPGMNPTLAHELGTGQPAPTVPATSFSGQIGGLMGVGQQLAASQAGSAAPSGGLTQLMQDSPVDPSVAAANFARNTHPQAAAANDVATTFQAFLSMLNGIGA